MLYPRRDFRPDHLPRLMSNKIRSWTLKDGFFYVDKSSRAASTHRREFKNEHQGRQRTYDRKVLREAWSEYQNGEGGE